MTGRPPGVRPPAERSLDGSARARRWLALLGALLGLGLIGYALFGRATDEERIHAQLRRLAAAVSFTDGANPAARALRLRGELSAVLTPEVSVSVVELGVQQRGREELVATTLQASSLARRLEVELTSVRIRIADDRATARAAATAVIAAVRRGGEPDAGEREVRFDLAKGDDRTWRVAACRVYAPTEEPEEDAELDAAPPLP